MQFGNSSATHCFGESYDKVLDEEINPVASAKKSTFNMMMAIVTTGVLYILFADFIVK